MKVAFFRSKKYEIEYFKKANSGDAHEIEYFEAPFNHKTVTLANGFKSICIFVNDPVDRPLIKKLKELGVDYILLRCAGFNHVDIKSAAELGIKVARVPAYSPYAVAEHTMGLILSLNRKLHRAFNRVRENNFSIDGLMGFDLKNKTVGVIGTGKIGEVFCKILKGFGCNILAFDPNPSELCKRIGVEYCKLDHLYKNSDIISLHCPLNEKTKYMINEKALLDMQEGVMIINTSRGGLIDTKAVINGLKSKKIGYLGLDVYEEEGDLFFEDMSLQVIQDDLFMRLLTFPNVFITGHQGFFTSDAMQNIAETTLKNLSDFERKGTSPNEVFIA